MKLITFGRNAAQAEIVLNSPHVSSYHAELLLLDNGDMLLIDKGSSNGTFVNGSRIAPEKEVTVTRQDAVVFADTPLNWASVPTIQIADRAQIKNLISVGSHYMNTIQVQGSRVSRFHATIKEMNNGKWFICDHSSNGTTLNGTRIPKDQFVPLKKSDVIQCAGASILNPVTKSSSSSNVALKVVLGVVAACLIAVGVYFIIPKQDPGKKIYAEYHDTTVALICHYYYRIMVEDELAGLWTMTEEGLTPYDGSNALTATATGFFISENGVIVTNLHVARPWLYGADEYTLKEIQKAYKEIFNVALADIKVDGVMEYIAALPDGVIFDETNAVKCREVICSASKEVDLAILQTMNNELPKNADYVRVSQISDEAEAVGSYIFTMGFPLLSTLQDTGGYDRMANKQLQATGAAGVITQNSDKYNYGFDAASYHGASGSPVFDKDMNLIGVVSSIIEGTQYNFCVKSRYINKLLKEAQE